MTPVVDLSRTELARVADVLEVLVAQHGHSVKAASAALHLRRETVGHILQRPAALRVQPSTLEAIATAAHLTVDQLRRGEAPPTTAAPSTARRSPRVLVRHSPRAAR